MTQNEKPAEPGGSASGGQRVTESMRASGTPEPRVPTPPSRPGPTSKIPPVSLRDFFHRRGIAGEVISLRTSLHKHPETTGLSVRPAVSRLRTPLDGDGFARGCRRADSIKAGVDLGLGTLGKDVGGLLPSWQPVAGDTQVISATAPGQRPRFKADYAGETRMVEGVLATSRISRTDFPLNPWHVYYDWNFIVDPDPQYGYLLSEANLADRRFECEWDTAFVPRWAWPQDGDRVTIIGRWIYDCAHYDGGAGGHKAEIHPPKAVISVRPGSARLPGNAAPTRTTTAVVFIGRDGGYWKQPINDQDYVFDLYLPPRPNRDAQPRFTVSPKTGALPVQPEVTPFPPSAPRALRVVVPLKGVTPHPDTYGMVLSAGWSDPTGAEASKITRLRVTIDQLFMDAANPPIGLLPSEWILYVGVNGDWTVFDGIRPPLSPKKTPVDLDPPHTVDLGLHPDDQIHVTASAFEPHHAHHLMNHKTGLTWAEVCDQGSRFERFPFGKSAAERIRSAFVSGGHIPSDGDENRQFSTISQFDPTPHRRGRQVRVSPKRDYRLGYTIEEI